MNETFIEWVRSPEGNQGHSWNPITGCLNHVNSLCKGGNFPCYAYRLAHGRLRSRYLANRNIVPFDMSGNKGYPSNAHLEALKDPFYPRFWENRIFDPSSTGKPSGVFVCDMGELFGNWIPESWQDRIWKTIDSCPQHRFYLLTKQPQNLRKFSPFPENCWVGVTATDDAMMWKALASLQDIEAKIKFLSLEPLLDWRSPVIVDRLAHNFTIVDWIIIGAQTKPTLLPKLQWLREIVRGADIASVPVFIKNNLWERTWKGEGEIEEVFWTKDGTLRQEMPF